MDRNTQTASATAAAIGSVASNFMLDAGTYQAAAEAGYGGMDFYFAGRAGVLGDASGSDVSDAVWLFEPGAVAAAWAASGVGVLAVESAQGELGVARLAEIQDQVHDPGGPSTGRRRGRLPPPARDPRPAPAGSVRAPGWSPA